MNVDEHKTGTKGDGLKTESSKVEFTLEQQARVQELIDETYKRAYAKAGRNMVSEGEVESIRGELGRLREDRKAAAILRAVSRHNVVDATEVTELVRPYVDEDASGNLVVRQPTANGDQNGGTPMAIDDYVDGWLAERPHHLRSSGGVGAGSRRALFGEGRQRLNLSDPNIWRNMPREDLDRLLTEGVDVQGVSGQVFKFKDVKNPFVEAKRRKTKSGGR